MKKLVFGVDIGGMKKEEAVAAVDAAYQKYYTENTMIVVTHEMEFAKSVADVVIYMADGVIEEMGTPQQVFEDPQSEKTRAFLGSSLEKY